MNAVVKYKYTPKIYKELVSNHLTLLKKKDICTKPYDDFNKGDNFIVVIPENFTFDRHNSSDISVKIKAKSAFNNLEEFWSDRCKYKTVRSVEKISNTKVFLLHVDSNI